MNCHFVEVTTCTCCDKLIRTGFLVNAMESLEYFLSATLRLVSAYAGTHARLTALFPGLPWWATTRKVKPIWILLKQETVSGSGISWAICKSAPFSRQKPCQLPTTQLMLVVYYLFAKWVTGYNCLIVGCVTHCVRSIICIQMWIVYSVIFLYYLLDCKMTTDTSCIQINSILTFVLLSHCFAF